MAYRAAKRVSRAFTVGLRQNKVARAFGMGIENSKIPANEVTQLGHRNPGYEEDTYSNHSTATYNTPKMKRRDSNQRLYGKSFDMSSQISDSRRLDSNRESFETSSEIYTFDTSIEQEMVDIVRFDDKFEPRKRSFQSKKKKKKRMSRFMAKIKDESRTDNTKRTTWK